MSEPPRIADHIRRGDLVGNVSGGCLTPRHGQSNTRSYTPSGGTWQSRRGAVQIKRTFYRTSVRPSPGATMSTATITRVTPKTRRVSPEVHRPAQPGSFRG